MWGEPGRLRMNWSKRKAGAVSLRPVLNEKTARLQGLYVHSRQFMRCGKLLFDLRQAFFKDIESDCGFLFGDDQRRAKANGGLAAAENHEAFFEAEGLNAIAQSSRGFTRCFVLDEFDPNHESASTHIANQGMC